MSIGTSLVLIAVGAILRFAVTVHTSAIDIQTVGTILMAVGVVGLILSVIWLTSYRDRRQRNATQYRDRDVY